MALSAFVSMIKSESLIFPCKQKFCRFCLPNDSLVFQLCTYLALNIGTCLAVCYDIYVSNDDVLRLADDDYTMYLVSY